MKEDFTIGSTGNQSDGLFWGVDVSSEQLDLACHGMAPVESFGNSAAGIERLVTTVSLRPAALIVVAATGRSIPAKCGPSPPPWANWPRPTPLMPA
jgi:hypothetical protein